MTRQPEGLPGLKFKINSILILFISMTPFNLSLVDKTGLDGSIDNALDKVVRVIWFLVAMLAVMLLKPRAIFESFQVRGGVLKVLALYFLVLAISLIVNNIGVIGYYRLLEYALLVCGLVVVGQVIAQEGKSKAVQIFSEWVNMVSWWTLIIIGVGLTISVDHFFALETQGRYRLGGNAYSPNFLGMVFALGILSGLYLIGQKRRGTHRLLLGLGCALFLFALYMTGSRTAQFSLLLALALWWYVQRAQISRLIIFIVAIFVVLPVLVMFFQTLIDWAMPLIGKGKRPIYDLLTLNNRSVVAEVGLKGALDNWGVGVGFVEGVKEYYQDNFTQSYWLPPHSHNALVEVFLSGGVVALLLMLVPFFSVFALVLRTLLNRSEGEDAVLAAMAVPLLLGCATMTIFGGVYTVLTFWFFSIAVFAQAKT